MGGQQGLGTSSGERSPYRQAAPVLSFFRGFALTLVVVVTVLVVDTRAEGCWWW